MSDRIIVMHEGHLGGELPRAGHPRGRWVAAARAKRTNQELECEETGGLPGPLFSRNIHG